MVSLLTPRFFFSSPSLSPSNSVFCLAGRIALQCGASPFPPRQRTSQRLLTGSWPRGRANSNSTHSLLTRPPAANQSRQSRRSFGNKGKTAAEPQPSLREVGPVDRAPALVASKQITRPPAAFCSGGDAPCARSALLTESGPPPQETRRRPILPPLQKASGSRLYHLRTRVAVARRSPAHPIFIPPPATTPTNTAAAATTTTTSSFSSFSSRVAHHGSS